MSSQPAATHNLIHPGNGLMYTAAHLLSPVFMTAAMGDAALAGEMAMAGIEHYHPTTQADYVNLARTIALSMASLLLLGHAVSADTPMPEKLRASGRANALSRSAEQSERTMMLRRRHRQDNPNAGLPTVQAASPLPDDDAGMQIWITEAMKEYLAAQTTAGTPPPVPEPVTAAAKPTAPVAAPERPAPSPPSAIHRQESDTRAVASYRQRLARTVAMPDFALAQAFQPSA